MTEKQAVSMYNGEVELTFYPNSHQYRVDGNRLPSVTGILGQLKQDWAMPRVAKMAKQAIEKCIEENNYNPDDLLACAYAYNVKQQEGKDVGSIAHDWIEERIDAKTKGKTPPEMPQDEKAANGVIAFLQWVNDNDVEFLASEQIIYSRDRIFCGKFDALAKVNGKTTLIDFKTSNSFHSYEFTIQLAGYASAYQEEKGKIDDLSLLGLHLSKETADFTTRDLTDGYEPALEVFNILVDLYHSQKRMNEWTKTLSE